MAKILSSNVNGSNRGENKRKVLNILQISADEKGMAGNMLNLGDKTLPSKKQTNLAAKSKTTEKENNGPVRRSKRTAVASGSTNYLESPEESKITKTVTNTKKSVAKSAPKSKKTVKSKKSSTVKKNEQSKLNQTKLNFSPDVVEAPNKEKENKLEMDKPEKCISNPIQTEDDSGYVPNRTSDEGPVNSTAILDDVKMEIPDDILMITSANPPLSYWKNLAEQRRIALEKALHENELLHDQLEVLEVENTHLKRLLKEAENLASIVKSIIE